MCNTSLNVLFIEFLVKRNRRIKIIDQLVGLFGKASSP